MCIFFFLKGVEKCNRATFLDCSFLILLIYMRRNFQKKLPPAELDRYLDGPSAEQRLVYGNGGGRGPATCVYAIIVSWPA